MEELKIMIVWVVCIAIYAAVLAVDAWSTPIIDNALNNI